MKKADERVKPCFVNGQSRFSDEECVGKGKNDIEGIRWGTAVPFGEVQRFGENGGQSLKIRGGGMPFNPHEFRQRSLGIDAVEILVQPLTAAFKFNASLRVTLGEFIDELGLPGYFFSDDADGKESTVFRILTQYALRNPPTNIVVW